MDVKSAKVFASEPRLPNRLLLPNMLVLAGSLYSIWGAISLSLYLSIYLYIYISSLPAPSLALGLNKRSAVSGRARKVRAKTLPKGHLGQAVASQSRI